MNAPTTEIFEGTLYDVPMCDVCLTNAATSCVVERYECDQCSEVLGHDMVSVLD